jgi:hypothetical protein
MTKNEEFKENIFNNLSPDDDLSFWSMATDFVLHQIETELDEVYKPVEVFAQIGACSRWLRPHQTRWTAAGGFAHPTGYGGSGYSRMGLPEFDWYITLQHNWENKSWCLVAKPQGKKMLMLRATFPTRTGRHTQAAIHTLWTPKNPAQTEVKPVRFFGFRKIQGQWKCVADSDNE